MQLDKTTLQLKWVDDDDDVFSLYLPERRNFNKQLDKYQQMLHQQIIDPDNISLNQK
ncbi:MAG: hypothetical protein ACJA0T_000245 [Colwellia sp.]|jgi:hypothetical protein